MKRPTGRRLLRGALLLGVWGVVLAVGLTGVEFFAQKRRGNPHYWEWDRLKIYNRRFYERQQLDFRFWPIPLELFDADKPTPKYLFKPNLKMTWRASRLEPAGPGDQVYRSTNSWGFRGPEFSVVKPPGVIRIVCLGASTTEGINADHETYPHYLQQELNRLLPRRRIEVLNAGHHNQAIEDLLEILRQRVLPLDPDIVLFYEATNDIAWWEFSRRDYSCDPASCLKMAYQGLFTVLYRNSAAVGGIAKRVGWRLPERPLWHKFDDASPKQSAAHYRGVLRRIAEETRGHGSRIVLASFVTLAHEGLTVRREEHPWLFDFITLRRHPFTPGEVDRVYGYFNEIVRDVAREYSAPFVDTAREFPRDPKYFPYDDHHFSAEGNRILAGIFARHLKDKILRPAIPEAGNR